MIRYFEKHTNNVCLPVRSNRSEQKAKPLKWSLANYRRKIIKYKVALKAFTTHDMNIAALEWSYCLSYQVRQST